MGKAIFVSYKYSDAKVKALPGVYGTTTARDYVDALEKMLEREDHVYKGEDDGEDISSLEDSTIGSKLGDKIFYSSVTIVLISKGMKNAALSEKEQWIPWEISYSLKEQKREGSRSKTNAVLAVVLPDEVGSYSYYMTENAACNSITYHTGTLFQILKDNMFNLKEKESNVRYCNEQKIYEGNPSYICSVKWDNFAAAVNIYIDVATKIRENINLYELTKTIK